MPAFCHNCGADIYTYNGWSYCPSCHVGTMPPTAPRPAVDPYVVFPSHRRRAKRQSIWNTDTGQAISVVIGGIAGIILAWSLLAAVGYFDAKPSPATIKQAAPSSGDSARDARRNHQPHR